MKPIRCPVCETMFDPEQSPAMPFCSARCKQIDLGRWLGEAYSMPVEGEAPEMDWDDDDR